MSLSRKICWRKNTNPADGSTSVEPLPLPVPVPKPENIEVDLENISEKDLINVQSEFKGLYKNDFNILYIHYSILFLFRKEQNELLTVYEHDLTILKHKLTLPYKEYQLRNIRNDIDTKIKQINDIKNQTRKKNYLNQVLPILKEYIKIKPLKKVVQFKRGDEPLTARSLTKPSLNPNNRTISEPIPQHTEEEPVVDPENEYRHQIISEYLEVAKTYLPINLIRTTESATTCKTCYAVLEPNEYIENELCPYCSMEIKSLFKVPQGTDVELKNLYKNNYSDNGNFYKRFLRFQGLQNNKIPDELFPKLDQHFVAYGYGNSEEIKTWQFNSDEDERFKIVNGKKLFVNREVMHEALSKTDYSDFYNDLNLILCLYWNFKLPNLSEYEAGIMEDYDKTQRVFLALEKDRTSSLNTDFRLYKHLQLRGYKCKMSHFKIIKTEQIQKKYEVLWKAMTEGAGLKYIPTDWS